MTDPQPASPNASVDGELVGRLAAHRAFLGVPREELEWLVAHGSLQRCEPGSMIARKGEPVEALYVILSGHVSHFTDQGGTWHKAMDWRGGDVTGQLPYSRLTTAPGNSVIQEPTEILRIERILLPAIPIECPHVTAALVHVMVDRARTFKVSDLQVEKMASLGRLAAGLAHELNNPASAAARSAQLVSAALDEFEDASRAIGAAGLDAKDFELVERVRGACVVGPTKVLSPLERADREESFADWLSDHDVDDALATSLAETGVALDTLDELAARIADDKLRASLRLVASGITIRGLARDIERAASRVHELVTAVKGFTYMDRAAASPVPVDVAKGLTDTLAVIGAKARGKSVSLTINAPADLPRVRGFGSELNQVWLNLVDNAIDAVTEGGRVTVTARAEGPKVVVLVIDDGAGIPPQVQSKIFDPFFTTKPVGQGTGLGLDIVRRLVDRSDGSIEVESVPGHTEFRVALPVVA
jgi:signal transduction histidine kinase